MPFINKLRLLAFIIGFGVGFLSFSANATSVYVGGWSKHFFADGVTNETHNLLMLEHSNILVGTMVNSFDKRSYIGGYQFDLYDNAYLDVNAIAGGMSGYSDTDMLRVGDIAVLAGVGVSIKTPYVQPTVVYAGKVVLFTFKVEF